SIAALSLRWETSRARLRKYCARRRYSSVFIGRLRSLENHSGQGRFLVGIQLNSSSASNGPRPSARFLRPVSTGRHDGEVRQLPLGRRQIGWSELGPTAVICTPFRGRERT